MNECEAKAYFYLAARKLGMSEGDALKIGAEMDLFFGKYAPGEVLDKAAIVVKAGEWVPEFDHSRN